MRILHPLQQDWILGLALIFLWPLAAMAEAIDVGDRLELMVDDLSLIHISEPTRPY